MVCDISQVTSRAMDLQGQLPSAEHAAILDYHIEGIYGLEACLAGAISTAQAGSTYGGAAGLDVDEAGVDVVLELLERLDVALDLLREHNGMYAAVLAHDLTEKLTQLSLLAQVVVESGLERSIAEVGKEMQERLAAFELSWKVAALSVAKLPADLAVDVAVGATISAAVPLVLGAAGLTGAIPAVAIAAIIAAAAAHGWSVATESWGPNVGALQESVAKTNGYVDVAADSMAIETVEAGMRSAARSIGQVSMGITGLLDLVSIGIAIEGIAEASEAWEAFKRNDARMRALWGQYKELFGNFLRFGEMTEAARSQLGAKLGDSQLNIQQLESSYGGALYEV